MKWLLIVAGLFAWQAQACEITMGYRTNARIPNINAKPDNAGLYLDLYQQAAQLISCKLNVVRLPKNRILRGLEDGSIDFYPELTFIKARMPSIFFYENGIQAANVGLTRRGEKKITNYDELAGKVILVPLGSPGPESQLYPLQYKRAPELSHERAIELILAKQADFYMDDFSTLYYSLMRNSRRSDLLLHLNCCGGVKRLTLGFAKKSLHFKSEPNPLYDPSQPMSLNNNPVQMVKGSVADKFRLALMELEASGFTSNLYNNYYGTSLANLMAEH